MQINHWSDHADAGQASQGSRKAVNGPGYAPESRVSRREIGWVSVRRLLFAGAQKMRAKMCWARAI